MCPKRIGDRSAIGARTLRSGLGHAALRLAQHVDHMPIRVSEEEAAVGPVKPMVD